MKKTIPVLAVILGWISVAWAAQPSKLTDLHAIHRITNAEAGLGIPVEFEATVTYYRAYEPTMFVQDGDVAIYVQHESDANVLAGDRVFVRGTLYPSFRPFVLSDTITLLRHGNLPKPVPATFDQLIRAQFDCMFVTVRGVVRAADLAVSSNVSETNLRVLTEGGYLDVQVDSNDSEPLKDLLDAEVAITGIVSGRFDGKMQQTGVLIHVSSLAGVHVVRGARASPWSLPATPMDGILAAYHVKDLTSRIRVHGTITYYQPGTALVLEEGDRSLWIQTNSIAPLRIGDIANSTGFPDVHDGFLTLTGGEIQDTLVRSDVVPRPVTWRQLTSSKHVFDLISIGGEVVTDVQGTSQDEYVLSSDGHLFSAIYRHPDTTGEPAALRTKNISVGSRVRVSGICIVENSNPLDREVPFSILMRSFDDIDVVAGPPWFSPRNLKVLAALLFLIVLIIGVREWAVERKVRQKIGSLAYIEVRRSRILEDINGSRPLVEIIEKITELISFKLRGAPCWCQIANGARLGNCPPKLTSLRIVQEEIPARSGPPLGTIFVALDSRTKPSAEEAEALSIGAGLATVSIESRRLYSELLHRSEFDLLTDIHNRFSLDKLLEALIVEARERASIFGLIYIDLDEFKQVNDRFGHHVGDLYLQEVAVRMKLQLRTFDSLARLGGDEFAALVPVVRSRADVEEIAARLERCFDAPFRVNGSVLHGSASVGVALYPEDGVTKDSLLNAADAAMYVAKKRDLGRRIPTRRIGA